MENMQQNNNFQQTNQQPAQPPVFNQPPVYAPPPAPPAKKPIFKKWWFWVIIAVVLVIAIAVISSGGDSSSGDSEETTVTGSIDPTGNNVVEDIAEYQIYDVFTTETIQAPIGSSLAFTAGEGNEFIVVAMKVKNLKSESERVSDLVEATLNVNGKDYSASDYTLTDGDTSVDGYSSIDALETAKVYFSFKVKKGTSTDGMVLTVKIGEQEASTPVSLSDYEAQKAKLEINKEITDGDTLSATVEKVYYTDIIEPTTPASYYRYYEAESGKTYLALKVRVKNLKGDDLACDEIAGAKCVYNDKYEYTASSCVEEDGGSDITYSNITSIAPLDTTVMYYFMEIPEDAEGGDMEVEFYVLGQAYYYTVK